MLNRDFFSKRFKLLRTTHNLSIANIADLLSLKSTGSVSPFESGKGIPSADILNDIADLFGVSIDWLTGRSDEPYNNEILLKLEEELLQTIEEASTQENMGYFRTATLVATGYPRYHDPATRTEFSLAVRANVVYLLNWFKYMSNELHVSSNIKSFDDFTKIVTAKFAKLSGRGSRMDPRWKACVEYHSVLQDILIYEKDIINPIFDITETFGLKHKVSDLMVNTDEWLYNLKTETQKSGISTEERQRIGNLAADMKDMIRKLEEKLAEETPGNKD